MNTILGLCAAKGRHHFLCYSTQWNITRKSDRRSEGKLTKDEQGAQAGSSDTATPTLMGY